MTGYHKIPGPFRRVTEGPDRGKLIYGQWSSYELADLAVRPWVATEKVDGTNIRVIWDGIQPEFRGRTDRADLPGPLLEHLQETFTEELLEQQFGATPAILYGEGYGPRIQKGGGDYADTQRFVLFDVQVGSLSSSDTFLAREDVTLVGQDLGIPSVPIRKISTLRTMIDDLVALNKDDLDLMSEVAEWSGKQKAAEGLVATPFGDYRDRHGKRIIVKLKMKDLKDFAAQEAETDYVVGA